MSRRLATGGAIDRARPIPFTFDGRAYVGFAGDTLASALLGAGVAIVGRSFKYHRPRGVWGHWVEEPNAIVDVVRHGRREPNALATTTFLEEGVALAARSVNTAPDAERDRYAFLDAFARFLPSGFYYKTFMWPSWKAFEPRIRAMAGLGRIDPEWTPAPAAAPRNRRCEVLVVGAGPSGLAAARAAAAAGMGVLVVDDRPAPGGSLIYRGGAPDGVAADAWIADAVAAIEAAGGAFLPNTTAYGVYDHNLVCALQRGTAGRSDSLWRIRPRHIILAAGAIERPLLFDQNDRPGILSAEAGLAYLAQYSVAVGERVAVATNNDSAYAAAAALREAGAAVTVVDSRDSARGMEAAVAAGIEVRRGERVARADGRGAVRAVRLASGATIEADALLVSGGFSPTVHLYCQAKGRLSWDERLLAFVPDGAADGMTVIGAANGVFSLAGALDQGRAAIAALRGDGAARSALDVREDAIAAAPAWPDARAGGRAWIDPQNDVTLKDVRLAARESYLSVEHLKRYTTLGMATDQGKTSNVNGVAALGLATGREIAAVGTTTYRPPFTPVPMPALAGLRAGQLLNPVRRLPLEARHRALGAVFDEYGGWLRPAFYGEPNGKAAAVERETRIAREAAAIFDGSPLGKIEVMGPDAAAFLDFNSYMTMSTLRPGRIRYGLMLQENGVVYDDGVVARLDADRFLVSCSTSHVAGVHARLEDWRQDQFDPSRVFVHNATAQWATLTVSGPLSRKLVERLDLGVDLADAALPHMALAEGRFANDAARVARVSFTGDRSYEVSARAPHAERLLDRLIEAGRDLGVGLIGLEALMILRAEKGYVVIGKDTDGTTMPHDLGFAGPREKRAGDFIGKRSLFTEVAVAPDRRQWVGFEPTQGAEPLPCGAHVVALEGPRPRSAGFVTSSYASPTLGRPIALGLIERGAARIGETITLQHLGRRFPARIAPACAFDPKGERLHA
ncbi:MAG: sarcosine oxidase subunit alpha family protein [Roseiarcus sp.]|jgi:sarcosine oxidase subunit alpha